MTGTFFPVDDDDLLFLREQWEELLSFYTSDPSTKDHSFQMLREKYSERGRFYHNLSHIKLLLHLLESYKDQLQDPHAIQFAIWFHDVVYDPNRNDNEEQSASLASETLIKLQVKIETIKVVKDLIFATKSHSGSQLSEDAKLFLDLDLAILGMNNDTYENYRRAIREEYAWVPERVYRTSRRTILESFLNRERIYFTDAMKTRFEEQARTNISNEITLKE